MSQFNNSNDNTNNILLSFHARGFVLVGQKKIIIDFL